MHSGGADATQCQRSFRRSMRCEPWAILGIPRDDTTSLLVKLGIVDDGLHRSVHENVRFLCPSKSSRASVPCGFRRPQDFSHWLKVSQSRQFWLLGDNKPIGSRSEPRKLCSQKKMLLAKSIPQWCCRAHFFPKI